MTLYEFIVKTLEDTPATRNNDNMLVAICLKECYGIENTFDLANSTAVNLYDSISRLRRKAQQRNPLLAPDDRVKTNRHKRELRIREEMNHV